MLSIANRAADVAGQILRKYYRTPLDVSFKSDESPVTRADQEAEAAIRAVISDAFPSHAVLGEERGGKSDAEYVWVVDPVDGTKAFITGRPTFATLIALLHDGEPILGIIDQPISSERWVGITGVGTTLNGNPVHVHSREFSLTNAVVQATTPDMFVGIDGVMFRRLSKQVKNVMYGGDCYAYATLASGCGDLVVEADLKPWDFLALVPVVEGAGGIMRDWRGFPLNISSDGRVIAAATLDLYSEAIEVLGAFDELGFELESEKGNELGNEKGNGAPNGLPEDPGEGSIESMTGYGTGTAEGHGITVTAQLRSVNSRFCEVQVKGPRYLQAIDGELISLVKRSARRGKIIASFDISSHVGQTSPLSVVVDKEATKAVKKLLMEVAAAAGISKEPRLSEILSFSEVLVRPDSGNIVERVQPLAKRALQRAISDLRCHRRREGALLQEDLLARTRGILTTLAEISERAPDRVEAEKARLKEAMDGLGVSSNKLDAEIMLYADRVDISEEVVRLQSHVQVFELTFFDDGPIGQRLGFLLQEMNREATTLASKSYDAIIAQLAVKIKEELERIREQCVNIR